jgi:hypothetical protein
MGSSSMEYAFAHHVWATVRVIDACLELTPEQLETSVPCTYGPVARTLRHLVGSDSWYLLDLTGDAARRIDEKSMDLCTALTSLGVEPPSFDVWPSMSGTSVDDGSITERYPTT